MQNNNSDTRKNIDEILSEIDKSFIYKPKTPKTAEVRTNKISELHKDHRKRLGDRIEKYGFDSLNEYEQLEFILFVTRPRIDTNDIAHLLINKFGTLGGVLSASVKDLLKVKGVGYRTASFISQLNSISGIVLRSFEKENIKFDEIQKMVKYIQTFYIGKQNEVFYMFLLDSEKHLIKVEKLSEGNRFRTSVYDHLIVKAASENHASYVVISHNHPSGNADPSDSDTDCTRHIKEVLDTLGVNLLDSVIIAKDKYFSYKENKFIGALNWMSSKNR